MIILKSFKYRFYPTQAQKETLEIQFGHCRFVYNWGLALQRKHYVQTGEILSYFDITRCITEIKRNEEFSWLRLANAQALQQSLRDLDKAWRNFFAGRAAWPRFKKKRSKQSYRYPQAKCVKINGKRVYFPKVGWVKVIFHRQLEGEVKNVTVSKSKSGLYFVSFQVEMEAPEPIYRGQIAGIDLGLGSYLALSSGEAIPNPRYLERVEKRLARLQRQMSRKSIGSSGWKKNQLRIARLHEKISNSRADFLHKLSRQLVQEHAILCVEDLDIKRLLQDSYLSKQIKDASWGMLLSQLKYKGEWYGCQIERIERWYPSSKTCSNEECLRVMKSMPLSKRAWRCPYCQSDHDRDINAARNIKRVGLEQIRKRRAGAAQTDTPVENSQWAFIEAGNPAV